MSTTILVMSATYSSSLGLAYCKVNDIELSSSNTVCGSHELNNITLMDT